MNSSLAQQGVAEEESQLADTVMLHPLYPRLLEAVMACRKVGLLNVADMNAIDQQCVQAQAAAVAAQHAARQAGGHLLEMAQDPELQAFMEASVAAAESQLAELTLLFQRADTANYDLGNHIVDLGTNGAALAQLSRHPTAPTESWPRDHSPLQASLSRSTAGDSTGSSVGSSGPASGSLTGCSSADTSSARAEVEHLGNALKRQYADRLSALQEEFSCKRSKGKLPDEAIEQLKQWWQQHPYWPYPTEDVKATLSCVTGLAPQQVSNWFVNQRKRYWHKLFPARQPQNAEEAEAMLRAHGLAVPDPSV
ncbi:hypothetical protein V8C86DRAFT_2563940 [Haematococcus lacustris]